MKTVSGALLFRGGRSGMCRTSLKGKREATGTAAKGGGPPAAYTVRSLLLSVPGRRPWHALPFLRALPHDEPKYKTDGDGDGRQRKESVDQPLTFLRLRIRRQKSAASV